MGQRHRGPLRLLTRRLRLGADQRAPGVRRDRGAGDHRPDLVLHRGRRRDPHPGPGLQGRVGLPRHRELRPGERRLPDGRGVARPRHPHLSRLLRRHRAVGGDQYNGIAVRVAQAKALGKPIIDGEMGIEAGTSCSSISLTQRAADFSAKISAQSALGVTGFMFWDWYPAPTSSCVRHTGGRSGFGPPGGNRGSPHGQFEPQLQWRDGRLVQFCAGRRRFVDALLWQPLRHTASTIGGLVGSGPATGSRRPSGCHHYAPPAATRSAWPRNSSPRPSKKSTVDPLHWPGQRVPWATGFRTHGLHVLLGT